MFLYTRNAIAFSLIELMIVIAILGIVAALAIPAYNDYIVRAKVTNMINAVSTVKQATSEYRGYHGNFADIDPADANATFEVLGIADPSNLTTTINEIKFATQDDDHVAIAVCGSAEGLGTNILDAVNVYFIGEATASGVAWECAYTGNSKYVPSSCRTLYDPEIYGELDGECENE